MSIEYTRYSEDMPYPHTILKRIQLRKQHIRLLWQVYFDFKNDGDLCQYSLSILNDIASMRIKLSDLINQNYWR